MKIISKFRDYYDSASGYDREDKPMFIRKNERIELDDDQRDLLERIRPLIRIVDTMPAGGLRGAVAFCGRAYPFYCYKDSVHFSFESLRKFVAELAVKTSPGETRQEEKSFLNSLDSTVRYSQWTHPSLNRNSWRRFQNTMDPLGSEKLALVPDDVFLACRTPIMVIWHTAPPFHSKFHEAKPPRTSTYSFHGRLLELNPILRNFGFASQVDPYTAYQEVDMFLGNNMACQEDPDAHLTDELKIHYKGFDKQYGFRKRPKGKK